MEVALLCSNMVDTKELSSAFRQCGVIPHFYLDMMGLRDGLRSGNPDLLVVDVEMMGTKFMSTPDDGIFKKEDLPVVCFCSPENFAFLISINEINFQGLIVKGDNYGIQIKGILSRIKKQQEIVNKTTGLENKSVVQEKRIDQLSQMVDEFQTKNHYEKELKRICAQFEKHRTAESLFHAIDLVFEQEEMIEAFSYVELAENGQRLISPSSKNKKFKQIPPIWLNKRFDNGMELAAQNMANLAGLETLGGHFISLSIQGRKDNPDAVLCLRVPSSRELNQFDWHFFETCLNGYHSYFLSKSFSMAEKNDILVSPWEIMSTISQHYKESKTVDELMLIDVDFGHLLQIIKQKKMTQFYWNNFFVDFVGRFQMRHKIDFKVACMGLDHLGFVVAADRGSEFFALLRDHVSRFSYWRFFEDVDRMVGGTIAVNVKMIPMSPEAYASFLNHGEVKLTSSLKSTQLEKVVQRAKNNHEQATV